MPVKSKLNPENIPGFIDDMKAKGKTMPLSDSTKGKEGTKKSATDDENTASVHAPDKNIKHPAHEPANETPETTPTEQHAAPATAKDADNKADSPETQIHIIPVIDIKPNPLQPRKTLLKENIDTLAESIKINGLIQPILIHRTNNKYTLIAGQQRLAAVKQLGHDTIQALVTTKGTDEDNVFLAMTENLQRTDLSKLDEADCYDMLANDLKLSDLKISKRIGKSRSYIQNIRQLKKLSPEVQKLLREEKTKYTNLEKIEKLKQQNPDAFNALAREDTITSKQIDELINSPRNIQQAQPETTEKPPIPDLNDDEINNLAVSCQRASLSGKPKVKAQDDNTRQVIERILELMPDKTQAATAIMHARKFTIKREKELLFPPE